MANKITKYGVMIVASALLVALAFAGAASADVMYNASEWNALDDTAMIALSGDVFIVDSDPNAVIYPKYNESTGFIPGADLTLDFSGYKGTFAGDAKASTKGLGALFGYVDLSGVSTERTLTIQNLDLMNVKVEATSGNNVGGIVGYFKGNSVTNSILNFTNCRLINSSVTGASGSKYVGGLVGGDGSDLVALATVNVDGCKALHCDVVSGSTYVGGFVGLAGSANFKGCNVTNSTVASFANAGDSEVGGLLGAAWSASFDTCGVEHTSVYGYAMSCGGLAGAPMTVNGVSHCTVTNCVIAVKESSVGGLLGGLDSMNNLNDSSVKNCTIQGTNNVGGLIGTVTTFMSGSANTVEMCAVKGTKTPPDTYTDLVVGFSYGSGSIGCTADLEKNYLNNGTGPYDDTITLYKSDGTICPFNSDFWNSISYSSAYCTRVPGPSFSVWTNSTNIGTYATIGGYGVGSIPTVTYDKNGADSGESWVVSYLPGSSWTVADQGDLRKTDYVFCGWNDNPAGTGTSYTPGQVISSITDHVTLYAIWSLSPYLEVSSWSELNKSVSSWANPTEARIVAVTADILDRVSGNETDGIEVPGKIILTTSGADTLINGNGVGRLFDVLSTGNLTFIGNGTNTLTLTGGDAGSGYGGIFVSPSGNLTLSANAMITNCSAFEGGAIFFDDNSTFTMTGGSITNCSVTNDGGAVYLFKNSTFIMTGGSITDCRCGAGSLGGAIAVYAGSTLTISGNVIIRDNTDGSTTNNVYLDTNEYLILSGAFTGKIGIYEVDSSVPAAGLKFGTALPGASGAANFIADNNNKLVGSISGTDLVWKDSTPTYTPTSSSRQSGYTIINQTTTFYTPTPTAQPTTAPTDKPADVPTVNPTVKPTTQQTQQSPAPFIGLIAGLGVAALVYRLRK